ncbi:hypothetical protein CALVIDRAFT_567319 [Calocera viscosa TUFC12733]|uniref:Uncharacterized protein n=1 Tax=Calocera viscosa (strain TUFC12733) TaxID=1330018 RepID=A0A167IAA8_CALVF|nr:hypothetical protein CALVIDRAFT_567319 [Calocera viscosa TUFC12733]
MLSFTTAITAILTVTAAVALPHREARNENALASRAGPSGYVVYPPGGTSFESMGGAESDNGAGGISFIHIQYQGIDVNSPYTQTIGVDVYLQDPTGVQPDQYLTYDFGNPNSLLIDGYFSPPSGACGDYNLVFVEHQNLGNFGDIIKFQAAAPAITIVCTPIQ